MTYIPAIESTSVPALTGAYWPIDVPPESPTAFDDEFTGTTLDAKWTPESYTTPATITVGDGVLKYEAPITATVGLNGITIDISSVAGDTNWAFTVGIAGWDYFHYNYVQPIMVTLSEGTSGAVGKADTMSVYPPSSQIIGGYVTSWANYAAGNGLGDLSLSGNVGGYMKITKTGTMYEWLWSKTGNAWWRLMYDNGLTYTPGRIVLGGHSENGVYPAVGYYKWFRKTG